MIKWFSSLLVVVFLLAGCATQETLTPEQLAKQQQVDLLVASALFDAGLDNQASYEVSENAEVTILFTPSVSEAQYTKVVNELRSDPRIPALQAEQDGKEVCPLRQ